MQRIDTSLKPVRRRLRSERRRRSREDILMNRWKNREHARRNLNNSCDTTPFLLVTSNHPHQPPDIYNNMRAAKYVGVNRERERGGRIISRISKAENGSCRRIFSPVEPGNPCHVPFPPDERSQESSYLYIVLSRARTFATALYDCFLRPYASRFSERLPEYGASSISVPPS